MREGLARWIGDEARRSIAESLTMPGTLTPLSGLIAGADHHPVIGNLDKQIEASATEVALQDSHTSRIIQSRFTTLPTRLRRFRRYPVKVGLPYFYQEPPRPRRGRGYRAIARQ